uniref:Peptidase M1 leukotriene A4 hydrolase/aminopeptidase C-terminal domain-containing protein n=1 Tax=Spongospora subterranea TaxID=70186 RepID=A0A0H5R867_9EUKA|eukprot:CRZ10320.1 hypothetical protein [Spongospora subterranea]
MSPTVVDPSTLSNHDQIQVVDQSLELVVDFATSTLSGSVELQCKVIGENVSQLILDTRDLDIKTVFVGETSVPFAIEQEVSPFGCPLVITLPGNQSCGNIVTVIISYSTRPSGTAVQWLKPQQTSMGIYPFCFTQCQAIHARSMLPCQDTPLVKSTYSARITVDPTLVALMSALSSKAPVKSIHHTTYCFEQLVPIPSYLIALAVGHLESREIGPRSCVWAEPNVVDAAADDFSETESFLKAAESICGRYVWGRYDILCLPPSFPYGGMENPCLTFVTPTLLTGDKSLANVVAHEIAHSWHGNLVTNATWEHFWLNEGFTVYVERKIGGKIHGDPYFHFQAIGGWNHLKEDVNHFGATSPLTKLCPDLKGIDPDDAFSSVPYEKGFNFLFYLENLFGRNAFESFLKKFIESHKFHTVTTSQFQQDVQENFASEPVKLSEIDWEAWLYSPGMPPVEPKFDQSMLSVVDAAARSWADSCPCDLSKFTSSQIVIFLDCLLEKSSKLNISLLEKIEAKCHFTEQCNAEIKLRWFQLCLSLKYEPIVDHVVKFITTQGRMKYVRPLYRCLFASGFATETAVATFKKHRQFYHPIAEKMISHDLKL